MTIGIWHAKSIIPTLRIRYGQWQANYDRSRHGSYALYKLRAPELCSLRLSQREVFRIQSHGSVEYPRHGLLRVSKTSSDLGLLSGNQSSHRDSEDEEFNIEAKTETDSHGPSRS